MSQSGRGGSPRWSFPPPPAAEPKRARARIPPQRVLRIAAGVVAALCAVFGVLTAYAALTLPSIDSLGRAAGTVRILDRNGTLIAEVGHDSHSRSTVPLSQIAPIMQDATVAAEDRNFYSEGAVDYTRVVHAAVIDVLSGSAAQGASTITQQLAKLAFLNPDRSPLRKLREALLANQLGERYSKQQILELYLNLIDYGEGAYGIEDAAERYFGVHASQLDLRMASLLAGIPQAPAENDPYVSPQTAFARQHYVLGALVSTRVIDAAQAASVDPLADDQATRDNNVAALRGALTKGHPPQQRPAPHFTGVVLAQLDGLLATEPQATAGSLDVTTTLDLGIQQHAESAVSSGVTRIANGANNAALVMIDPGSGDVLAMVGSADFGNPAIAGQYDVVTGERRPGSTFKPIVYATAFAEGKLDPNSTLQDTAQESAALGGAHDFDNSFPGPMSVRDALLGSRNVPAEQAMLIAGVDNVIETAHKLGITTDLASNATTAIGTSAVRMIDLAAVYGALANGGTRVQPRAILRVATADGNVLYDAGGAHTGERVLDPAVTQSLTSILLGYSAHWNLSFDRAAACKSGTTDNNVDAWYVAYAPRWVITAWAGHTDGTSPAEVGMNGVGGNDVGREIVIPFVATLPQGDDGFPPQASPTPTPGGGGDQGGGGGD